MRRLDGRWLLAALLASFVSTGSPVRAGDEILYIETAEVLTGTGKSIEGGKIVVKNGKITEVGADVRRPRFSKRIDARDRVVTPGFVVPWSHVGLPPAGRRRGGDRGLQVGTRPGGSPKAELIINPTAQEIFLGSGITSIALFSPGTNTGFRGRAVVITPKGRLAKDLVIQDTVAAEMVVAAHPTWRKKIGDVVERHEKKQDEAKKSGKKKKGKASPTEEVLTGKRPLIVQLQVAGSNRSAAASWVALDDVLPLKDMNVSILETGHVQAMADELKRVGARVLTYPVLVTAHRTRYAVNRAAALEKEKVPYAFILPSDSVGGATQLRDAAIEMIRTGCSEEKVLAALTSEAAKAIGMEKKLGSIAKGRRADLLFFDGPPFVPTTSLSSVWVAGEEVELMPIAQREDS
ncbi:MAG: amidohydrolase family protein [Acidobacteriota bacterium]